MNRLILVLFYMIISLASQAQMNADSLWNIWSDEAQSAETRLEALKLIHQDKNGMLLPKANQDTMFYHAQLMYDMAVSNGLEKWKSTGLKMKGDYFKNIKDYDQATTYYDQSLAIAEEIGSQSLIGAISYNQGMIYFVQTNYSEGLPAFSRAAKSFEASGDIRKKAHALDRIGALYMSQNDVSNGIKYIDESLAIREALIKEDDNNKDRFVIEAMKMALINLLESQGDSLRAKEYILDDSEPSMDGLSVDESSKSLAIMSMKALHQGNEKEAFQFLNESLQNSEESGVKKNIIGSLTEFVRAHYTLGDTIKAIPYLVRIQKLALEENDLRYIVFASGDLYKIYETKRQYQDAHSYFKQFIKARDSLVNIENSTAMARLEIQTEFEKEKIKNDLENANILATQTQKKKNQQFLSASIGAGLILSLILALIIFKRLKITRQQNVIIEEQKKKAEQSEKYKEQFLANMSHEFRTPMHAISGMVKILKRNKHYTSQDVYLNAIESSSENLVVVLNDILDLSKIEAGKLDIESIPMNPATGLENAYQLLKYNAEEKGITLDYQVQNDVPEFLMGDPARLNQILLNLIGNAIKFTEQGSVQVGLEKIDDTLKYSIQDTGIGISKDKIQRIFREFEQAKDSTTRLYGGTGLGLSIAKQLVELQGGTISVESEMGGGSTFYVELPIVAVPHETMVQHAVSEGELQAMANDLKGIRILLAEDNAFNKMIAQDDLLYYIGDVTLDIVENGILAIDKYKTEDYDLILMDVQMPEMNGFEATRKIREMEKLGKKNQHIPIIAMTASLLKSEIVKCYDAGMDNYIPKPYKIEEFIGSIYKEMKK